MFDYLAGYGLDRFREAVANGNLIKVQKFINYYKARNKLDYILHDYWGAFVIKAPPGFYGSNLLFDAFRIKDHPQYEAAFMLLEAGTRPSYVDAFDRNIYHFMIGRGELNFFRYMLFYDKEDFSDVLKISYGGHPATINDQLNAWDRVCPGRKDRIINTANDVKVIRARLAQVEWAPIDITANCYFEIATLYLKHADYEKLPEYKGLDIFRKKYLIKAYKAFQKANESYEKLTALNPLQKAKSLEALTHLISIANELNLLEDELLYSARLSLGQTNAAQAPFLAAAGAGTALRSPVLE
ncbi:MAG: hypothetical protein Q7V63_07905 [Gammaproteobacteria bacterium]|nr:hypothetical protein [Gammaproteobacteria bacterium]